MQAIVENRADARSFIEAFTLYRCVDEDQFLPARIGNISNSGILIWLDDALMVGEKIEVVIAPIDDEHDPKLLTAEVVRILDTKHNDAFGYGCRISASAKIADIEF